MAVVRYVLKYRKHSDAWEIRRSNNRMTFCFQNTGSILSIIFISTVLYKIKVKINYENVQPRL